MPRLSMYKTGYDSPEDYECKQWKFLTEEERSLIIGRAYEQFVLTPK
jgi:hypothetical protein